jgi:deazaflavin-dependent oxidoreductase (nitroreductase family)
MSANDWNAPVIAEFRANEGRVGGPFEGAALLLLTTLGRKSGREHTTPVMYFKEGDRFFVIASKAGAPTHPDWYYNLLANPDVTVEVGTEAGLEKFAARATATAGAERDRLYAAQAERVPGFAEYQEKTERVIPVVALERQ